LKITGNQSKIFMTIGYTTRDDSVRKNENLKKKVTAEIRLSVKHTKIGHVSSFLKKKQYHQEQPDQVSIFLIPRDFIFPP